MYTCQMVSFSDWLVNELRVRNISQAELARKSGVSQPVISRVISNERNPSPDTLQKFAKGLRININEVYLAAGILPSGQDIKDALSDRFAEVLADLSEDDIDELYNIAILKLERKQRNK